MRTLILVVMLLFPQYCWAGMFFSEDDNTAMGGMRAVQKYSFQQDVVKVRSALHNIDQSRSSFEAMQKAYQQLQEAIEKVRMITYKERVKIAFKNQWAEYYDKIQEQRMKAHGDLIQDSTGQANARLDSFIRKVESLTEDFEKSLEEKRSLGSSTVMIVETIKKGRRDGK
jgi:hypothetical protein